MKSLLPVLAFGLAAPLAGQNQAPVLSNINASANWTTQTLTLSYDVSDTENDPVEVSVEVSNTGGDTYLLTAMAPASGDLGFPVTPGSGKSITLDLAQLTSVSGPFTLRLVAFDHQPFPFQDLVNEVDSNRLRNDLEFVQGIRHRTGGPVHLAATQDTLRNCFSATGIYLGEQTFTYQGYTGRNIYGTHRGTVHGQQVVVVDAHYDSVVNAPGADDNGSGTVGVMEIARLLSRYPTKKTVRFIGFDLEEAGTIGSLRYVQTGIPAGENIDGVYNFEMIGYYTEAPNTQSVPTGFNQLFPAAYNEIQANQFRGDFLINVGNAESLALGTQFDNLAAQYVPDLSVISIYPPGNSEIAPDLRRSDHARFWDAGDFALMLTDGADFRNSSYHTPSDTLGKLNFTFMSNIVKATLVSAAVRAEIQHGDWATTTFSGSVGTDNFDGLCDFTVGGNREGSLYLLATDCALRNTSVEVFDGKGSLLFSQVVDLSDNPGQPAWMTLPTPISPGMYLIKISNENGSATKKVVIP